MIPGKGTTSIDLLRKFTTHDRRYVVLSHTENQPLMQYTTLIQNYSDLDKNHMPYVVGTIPGTTVIDISQLHCPIKSISLKYDRTVVVTYSTTVLAPTF